MTDTALNHDNVPLDVRRRATYPRDDLGFLQRTQPVRGQSFGQLVYMADSVMRPMRRAGFGMHPHANVEIVSYVVDGELTHRDSAGNTGVVAQGGFQRITAGTGLEHDESNRTDRPLRMFQIWFAPTVLNAKPGYATIGMDESPPSGSMRQMIGNDPGALEINADATISLGRVDAGDRMVVQAEPHRATLLYIVSGRLSVGNEELGSQDQIRATAPTRLEITGLEASDFLLIESAL